MGIGEFAAASGLTAKALRLYDELDLLPPAEVDPANGYRRYDPAQLEQAQLVARLRLIGMPLARIRAVAGMTPVSAAAELRRYWRQVEADTASRRALLTDLVTELTAQEASMRTTTTHDWTIRTAVRDDIGGRELHEDAAYAGTSVFAVADGFSDGADAARTAITEVTTLDSTDGDSPDLLAAAVARAASTITAAGQGGTTLTAAWLRGDEIAVAHIGDSRLYRRRDAVLELLTRDHTMVASLVEDGRLTEEEARCHPDRVLINRALAPDSPIVEPDLSRHDVRAGDWLVLTTDGVHGHLSADELATLLTGGPQEAVDRVAAAIEAAGAPDNFAVVVAELS